MIPGSTHRKASHPVEPLFLDRWSSRAMSGEALTEEEILGLLEAARWAPSSSNHQPWRALYARRGSAHWQSFLDLLFDGNRVWAQHAGALVLFISSTVDDLGRPIATHSYDTGAAWENFALQGWLMKFVVHGVGGFERDQARVILRIPEKFHIEAMAVVGKPGDPAQLPETYRQREIPNARRPLEQSVCEGPCRF